MCSDTKNRLLNGEPVELIHCMHQRVCAKRNHRVTRPLSSIAYHRAFRLREGRQHIVGLPPSLVVIADSDSQSRQRFRSHAINDVLHSVMTCRTAFRTNANSANGQMDVVSNYEYVFGIEAEAPRQVTDSFSASVYEQLWLHKYNRTSSQSSFRHETSCTAIAPKLATHSCGQQVKNDESDVMAGSFIPRPGIAQSNDEPLAASHCIPGFATGRHGHSIKPVPPLRLPVLLPLRLEPRPHADAALP